MRSESFRDASRASRGKRALSQTWPQEHAGPDAIGRCRRAGRSTFASPSFRTLGAFGRVRCPLMHTPAVSGPDALEDACLCISPLRPPSRLGHLVSLPPQPLRPPRFSPTRTIASSIFLPLSNDRFVRIGRHMCSHRRAWRSGWLREARQEPSGGRAELQVAKGEEGRRKGARSRDGANVPRAGCAGRSWPGRGRAASPRETGRGGGRLGARRASPANRIESAFGAGVEKRRRA